MTDDATEGTETLEFHVLKSPHFRVLHVDGAMGGLTPGGLLHAAVYSERGAIPTLVEAIVAPDGSVVSQEVKASRRGVVREIDADLVMSIQTAIEFRDWLDKTIKRFEEISASNGSSAQ